MCYAMANFTNAMQVLPHDDQILNQYKLWWPNLQLMQVAPSGGQICNQWK